MDESTIDRNSIEDVVISVLIAGAGPAGLMLATLLTRFGIDIEIVDERPDKTSTGRADGLQPKTIETFKQMRIAESLLRRGVKVYDICHWNGTAKSQLSRTSREVHYPKQVDTIDPYILLVHQGMIEDIFLDELKCKGVDVNRSMPFVHCKTTNEGTVETTCIDDKLGLMRIIRSKYVVGCDGAHSRVRRSLPGVNMVGESGRTAWGVLDGICYHPPGISDLTNKQQAYWTLTSPTSGPKHLFIRKKPAPC